MMRLPIFELGADGYDFLTGERYWREQIARVLDYAEVRSDLRVLDLGCGPGVSSFVLAERLGPGAEIVGIDLAARMLARAERHHRRRHPELTGVRFERADATALPFEDGRFDLAVGHSFLYLVPDRPAVLAEVRRVLAPGGRLVLMEPSREGSLLEAARHAGGVRAALRDPFDATRFATAMVLWRLVSGAAGRLDRAEAARLLSEAGFREVAIHPTLGGLGIHCVGRR